MNGRQSDFEELRPLSEATRVPDDELSERGNAERPEGRRREGLDSYPDDKLERFRISVSAYTIAMVRKKRPIVLSNRFRGISVD